VFQEIFFKKDYRNERFHRKRSLYLCCIAAHLLSSDLIEGEGENGPKFVLGYNGDPLLPVLEVSPSGYLAHKAKVRIHAFASSKIFKLSSLAPSKCNMDPTEDEDSGNFSCGDLSCCVGVLFCGEDLLIFISKCFRNS